MPARGPLRAVEEVERSADGAWILAVRLKGCGHRVVYARRQSGLRGHGVRCPDCRGAGRGAAPGARSPGPGRRIGRLLPRRPAGAVPASPAAPTPAPSFPFPQEHFHDAARARADRERRERLLEAGISQAERQALEAARAVLRAPCGHVDHQLALEELGRVLGQLPEHRPASPPFPGACRRG